MKQSVGVFFGGKSPEHDISIITGQLVISGLKGLGYPVVPVYIDKTGSWYADEMLGDMRRFTTGQPATLKGLDQYALDLTKSRGKIVLRRKGFTGGELSIDIAFPTFHGSNGEDGTAQGMFEFFGLPYVGCDTTSSAVAMDKVLTKLLYQSLGIPTVPFVFFRHQEWDAHVSKVLSQIEDKLEFPLMVKPATLGSSIGISKAYNTKELNFALEVAFHYDNKVIIEKAVSDLKDITCAVIGSDRPVPSLLQESSYGKDFFSYEDKYLKEGGAQLGKATQSIIIPAGLDAKTTKAIQATAIQVYTAFGCSGTARVDFLYDTKAKTFYVNEINTMPGTLYHHLWKKSGIDLGELLEKLLGYALERHKAKERLTYTFESSVLSRAGSAKMGAKAAA
jgi:D-alanine-D-alanine ligase